MAGRWSDEYDWRGRDRSGRFADDRYDERNRDEWEGREDRSWQGGERVFGERDYGAGYNRPPAGRSGGDWQDPDYGGVSPAMRRGDYEAGYGRGGGRRSAPRFQSQDYTRGGRYYGDDARQPIYREEYGLGGREYGRVPRGYDEGERFGTREADQRWAREMRRPAAGGTGGYDYERGYGDAGRRGSDEHEGLEDRAREAGEFFRRTGHKISSWFSGDDHPDYDEDRGRYQADRGHRGLGPKGYQRSDERIDEEVHQRLTDDGWLDATHINVSVSGGEVTLSGTVENREAKHRAERLVEDLSGVKHVQNNLRVDEGSFFTRAGRGYGDSARDQAMRNEPVERVTDGDAQKAQGLQQSGSSGSSRSSRN